MLQIVGTRKVWLLQPTFFWLSLFLQYTYRYYPRNGCSTDLIQCDIFDVTLPFGDPLPLTIQPGSSASFLQQNEGRDRQ